MSSLAWIRRLQGDFEAALTLADSSFVTYGRLDRAEPTEEDALALLQSGQIRAEMGDVAAGLAQLRAGDSLFRNYAEAQHPLTFEGPMRIGIGLALDGAVSEAEASFLLAIGEADAYLPPGHPYAALPRFELGRLYAGAGRLTEAEGYLRDALEIQEATLGPDHWRTARSRAALGSCLASMGASGDAGPLLMSARAALSRALGAEHPYTLEVASQIAGLQAAP